MLIKGPISNKQKRELVTAFVDDMDFFSNGINYQENMQKTIDTYAKLYQATGSKIQIDKTFSYCRKWN